MRLDLKIRESDFQARSKEEKAMKIIAESLRISKNPVVCCSFGKDSLTILDMVHRFDPTIPIVYLMDGKPMNKNLHAFKTAAELGVKLYTYPPTFAEYYQDGDYFEVMHSFYVNGIDWYVLYNGCRQYLFGEDYACAVVDLLRLPTVDKYDFQWDCIFHGQKQIESIHILNGQYRIKAPIIPYGNGIMSMPVYDWSEDDIWEYVNRNGLKVQRERYADNPTGEYTQDKRDLNSSDVLPTCFSCLDYRNDGHEVVCPKLGKAIKYLGKRREEHAKYAKDLLTSASYVEQIAEVGC
jgi:hypothetical protein